VPGGRPGPGSHTAGKGNSKKNNTAGESEGRILWKSGHVTSTSNSNSTRERGCQEERWKIQECKGGGAKTEQETNIEKAEATRGGAVTELVSSEQRESKRPKLNKREK